MQDPTVLIVIKMKELKAASCKMSSGFEFQIIISWGILVEKEKKTLVAHLYACKEGSAVLKVAERAANLLQKSKFWGFFISVL